MGPEGILPPPPWRGNVGSRWIARGTLAILLLAMVLLVSSAALTPAGVTGRLVSDAHPAKAGSYLSLASVTDNQQISIALAGIKSLLSDTVAPIGALWGVHAADQRAYWVNLSTPLPFRTIAVNISTAPMTQWAFPNQIAGGADVIPPFQNWTWTVWYNGIDDSANWSVDPNTATLSRLTAWTNCSWIVVGTEHLTASLAVNDRVPSGAIAPNVGVVLANQLYAGQIPRNDPGYAGLLGNLTPHLVRWSEIQVAPASWNNTTGTPSFYTPALGPLFNLTGQVGAVNMIDLPVGTWGDGNVLPANMPLNTSQLLLSKSGGTGYLPTLGAYQLFVKTFVADALAAGLPSRSYWNIGNEVPVWQNTTLAAAYVPLYNAAAQIIHNASPGALVGSDVMARPTMLTFFAQNATGVDFLEFHFYPANGGCPNNTTFCPPNDLNSYYTDGSILARSADFAHGAVFLPPLTEQWDWFNITHHWLPILNTEANLNSYDTYGTDPRQQTLFDAAWIVSQFVDAAATGLGALTLFALEGPYSAPGTVTYPYGGWGYSLASEINRTADTLYAPYWATELWGNSVAAGSVGYQVATSDPDMIRAFAAPAVDGFNLVLASRNALPTTVRLAVSGLPAIATNVTILDPSTYSMGFNGSSNSTDLTQSGVATQGFAPMAPLAVNFAGYGVAVVHFVFTNGPQQPSGGATQTAAHWYPALDPTSPDLNLTASGPGGAGANLLSVTGGSPFPPPAKVRGRFAPVVSSSVLPAEASGLLAD